VVHAIFGPDHFVLQALIEETRALTSPLLLGAMALPAFHLYGMCWQFFAPLFTARPIVLFAPRFPQPAVVPSPANVLRAVERTGANSVCAVPSFLEVSATKHSFN
jgi:acyl-coenzyme A synthetase/AMP-(fatty) acid ligase